MKNKKSIAMAMAAASTFGAVAPAFANEVAPLALDKSELTVDYRLANGEELVKNAGDVLVLEGRASLYNDNFTPDDKTDDTLKSEYKNAQIFMSRNTNDKEDANDLFVLVKKVSDASDISMEKAKLDTMIAEINAAKEAGAEIEVGKLTKANIDSSKQFVESTIKVTVTTETSTDVADVREYVFNGVPGIEEEKITEVFENPFTGLTDTANVEVADVENLTDLEKDAYYALNKFKLVAEQNKDKVDFVKAQDDANNANLVIKVYKKGDKQIPANVKFTMTLQNFAKLEKELVMNISEGTDFANNWAKEQIEEAMLTGKVDASKNFRPQASITRAEFAKVVCTMFGIEPKDTDSEPFHDVSKADGWKYDYIAALYTQGADGKIKVIQGSNDKFRPDDKISRQEVAVILAKMIKQNTLETVMDVNGTDVDKIEKTKFDDTKDIAGWADESVIYLSTNADAMYDTTNNKYVVQGSNNKFNPKQEITRAEALVMIERAAIAESKIARP